MSEVAAGPGANDEPKKKGSPIKWVVLLIVLALCGAAGYHYWANSGKYESTDNAQIEGDVVPISAEVSARIIRIHVTDNQRVKKGQLLLELERTDYANRLAQAEATLKSAQQRRAAAQAQLALTERQASAAVAEENSSIQVAEANVVTVASGVDAARDRLRQAQAGVQAAQANIGRARSGVTVAQAELNRISRDVQRYQQLYNKEEISRQQYEAIVTQQRQAAARVEAARDEVRGAQAQFEQSRAVVSQAAEAIEQSQAQVAESRSRVGEARAQLQSAETGPEKVAVAAAQVRVVAAEIAQARTAVEQAQKDLARTKIYAPSEGIVTKRSAQLGGLANKGTSLMALVVQPKPWVVANFKETQMERIRPGVAAEISVDTYPGKTFPAHVQSVQPGTGARFSLLPPENAGGSFVKVVQRIPVRIELDNPPPADMPLVPGMSVEARVRVR